MKHMILTFKMKGDIISDHFLMLWFQKDSLDTVGFKKREGGVPKLYVIFWWPFAFFMASKTRLF